MIQSTCVGVWDAEKKVLHLYQQFKSTKILSPSKITWISIDVFTFGGEKGQLYIDFFANIKLGLVGNQYSEYTQIR